MLEAEKIGTTLIRMNWTETFWGEEGLLGLFVDRVWGLLDPSFLFNNWYLLGYETLSCFF